MANPVVIDLPADEWTKVATAVKTGLVHKLGLNPNKYLQTYKLTGEAAPMNISDGVMAFLKGEPELISHSVSIDVYIYPVGKNGKVRADL